VASNGRRVAIAGELYHNKSHAERMVNKLFPGVAVEVAPNKAAKKAAKKVAAKMRPFKAGDIIVPIQNTYTKRQAAYHWDERMKKLLGIPLKCKQVTHNELIVNDGLFSWSFHPHDVRHATPAEVRKFNAQNGKA
jgi:hypothetical protein